MEPLGHVWDCSALSCLALLHDFQPNKRSSTNSAQEKKWSCESI